jgi:hypothetical protein
VSVTAMRSCIIAAAATITTAVEAVTAAAVLLVAVTEALQLLQRQYTGAIV